MAGRRCDECNQRPEDGCMFGCQTSRAREAEAARDEALKLVGDLFDLVETSSRWLHDSTLWEQEDYDDYLPPQWKAIRERYAAALRQGKS